LTGLYFLAGSLFESLDESTDVADGQLSYESLDIVHKVLGVLRDWTRGDGLTESQAEALNSYYATLKDCDYEGELSKGLVRAL
jgi:hypothetical protein